MLKTEYPFRIEALRPAAESQSTQAAACAFITSIRSGSASGSSALGPACHLGGPAGRDTEKVATVAQAFQSGLSVAGILTPTCINCA